MKAREAVAKTLYMRRTRVDVTQQQLAEALNVKQPTISHWESGYVELTVVRLVQITDHFPDIGGVGFLDEVREMMARKV